ncbi:MAG: hypothetical protein R3B48_19925 [Kofleriaceae bacterium]
MARSSILLVLVSLVALSACAGGSSKRQPTTMRNQDGDVMVCHEEFPTGSHIGRTVCRTEEQTNREREEAREFIATPRPVRPPPPPPSGQ